MIFDKQHGHIFNVRLNASEAKALEDYCQKYLQEKVDAYIAEKKEEIEKNFESETVIYERIRGQLAQDSAIISLHDAFGYGPEHQVKFNEIFVSTLNRLTDLMMSDLKDDEDMVYSRGKIDGLIRAALGDKYFLPWEVRYGMVRIDQVNPKNIGSAYDIAAEAAEYLKN